MTNRKQVIITRKIQLVFNTHSREEMVASYDKLYEWQRIVAKAANWIATHHYVQENLQDLFYLTDETKVRLADIKKDAEMVSGKLGPDIRETKPGKSVKQNPGIPPNGVRKTGCFGKIRQKARLNKIAYSFVSHSLFLSTIKY